MSTKSSIILTEENEHWYIEVIEYDGPDGDHPIYIEFAKGNFEIENNDEGELWVRIRGDCELARILTKAQFDIRSAQDLIKKK